MCVVVAGAGGSSVDGGVLTGVALGWTRACVLGGFSGKDGFGGIGGEERVGIGACV